MARDWNGLSLQTRFSELFGDSSTSGKARVLEWINDIAIDIGSWGDANWSFLRHQGKKVLTADTAEQSLNLGKPTAPTIAASTGGALADTVAYKVLVTFYEGLSSMESIAGAESNSVTIAATDQTLDVTSIPVSADPLVTARKIYLIKASGEPLYYSTIEDNTTTTATVTADTTSLIEAPDFSQIHKIDDDPYIEDYQKLVSLDTDTLSRYYHSSGVSGTPQYWANLAQDRIFLQPYPSTALTLTFYHYKLPRRIYANTDTLEFPPSMKEVLEAGMEWKGYKYPDRNGKIEMYKIYEDRVKKAIDSHSAPRTMSTKVNDVMGDTDGRFF